MSPLGTARALKTLLQTLTTSFGVEQKLDEFIDAFTAYLKENEDLQDDPNRRITVAPYFSAGQ